MYLHIVPAPTHIVPAPTRISRLHTSSMALRIGVNRHSPAGCLTANFTTAMLSADNIGK